MVLPRPHVLVHYAPADRHVATLCHVMVDGRYNTMSILVPMSSSTVDVASIFGDPQKGCGRDADCYLIQRGRQFNYEPDLAIVNGDFLRLFEWMRQDDESAVCPYPSLSGSDASGDALTVLSSEPARG